MRISGRAFARVLQVVKQTGCSLRILADFHAPAPFFRVASVLHALFYMQHFSEIGIKNPK